MRKRDYASFDQYIIETFTSSGKSKHSSAPNFWVKLIHALNTCQQLMLKLSFAISACFSAQKPEPVLPGWGFN